MDLSMVDTGNLLDEIEKRFESMAFIGEYKENLKEDMFTHKHFHGSFIQIFGLLDVLKYELLEERSKTRKSEQ